MSACEQSCCLATALLMRLHPYRGPLAHFGGVPELGVNAVIGTTGFSARRRPNRRLLTHIAIMIAPNMSSGVNVVVQAARHGWPLR